MSFQLQMEDLCLSCCLNCYLASKNGLTNICSKQQKIYGQHWPKMAVCLLKEKNSINELNSRVNTADGQFGQLLD